MSLSVQAEKRLGTLVPIAALRSLQNHEHDQGTFDDGALFLEWLQQSHQSLWQLLPLHTTQLERGSQIKHVPSPYKGYGIGLDPKYLSQKAKLIIPTKQQKEDFLYHHHQWIEDYVLFEVLRDYFHTDDWSTWDKKIRDRDPQALRTCKEKFKTAIDIHLTQQWQLHHAFEKLREKASAFGIFLSGDLPFYVAHHSPLVWAHQYMFDLVADGSMQHVSGVPDIPTSFFQRQVWGHPLYDWKTAAKTDDLLSFWKIRIRYMATLYDSIRFDYAEAFFHYGVMDPEDEENDTTAQGPGALAFEELSNFARGCGLTIFVEDSGAKTEEMRQSLRDLSCSGIRILRFAIDEKKDTVHEEFACVSSYTPLVTAFTSTHDTETLLGFIQLLSVEQKHTLAKYVDVTCDDNDKVFAKKLRDAVIHSPATTVIIPIQDWLLTTERINIPGTEKAVDDPNWNFTLTTPIENLPTHF